MQPAGLGVQAEGVGCPGTLSSYALAMRYPGLSGLLLRLRYAMSGTDKGALAQVPYAPSQAAKVSPASSALAICDALTSRRVHSGDLRAVFRPDRAPLHGRLLYRVQPPLPSLRCSQPTTPFPVLKLCYDYGTSHALGTPSPVLTWRTVRPARYWRSSASRT
eukprot:2281197-Rhodomonas_salina.3